METKVAPAEGLWVVVPALNEKDTIAAVVAGLRALGAAVLVVDDGSTDGTGALASAAGATILRHERPLGYDRAVSEGINHAFEHGAVAVVTCDADGQHSPEDVRRVASVVLDGTADFAAGVRDRYNRVIERAVGWVARPLFGTRDPFCGLKAYGRELYRAHGPLPADMHIGSLPLAWAAADGLRTRFQPITCPRRRDQSRFARALRGNLLLGRAFARTVVSYASSTRSARTA